MRFVLVFVTFVSAIIMIGALTDGDRTTLIYAVPITAVLGFFTWQNLRDPAATRKNGRLAQITFAFEAGAGVTGSGTFARVKTHGAAWHVALDRMPERGDLDMYGVAQRGWVWLNEADLPERVKINYAMTWKTWPVVSAALAA
jgi:hypothetical protein